MMFKSNVKMKIKMKKVMKTKTLVRKKLIRSAKSLLKGKERMSTILMPTITTLNIIMVKTLIVQWEMCTGISTR